MNLWRRPWSLVARLRFLVIALALPLLLIIALSFSDELRERRELEVESLARSTRNGASIVEGFLRDLESTTFATAGLLADSTRPHDQPTLGGYLASVTKIYPELRAYFVTDANGRVVASASGEGIGLDLSSRPYLLALKAGADRVWSGSIVGLQSGEITVAFGRPIRRADGTTRGYVVTAFYPERVLHALRVDYPSDAQLLLVDERGRLLYASDRAEPATTEIDLIDAPGVRDALSGRTVRIDGAPGPIGDIRRYGSITPIPRTGWALALTRPAVAIEGELMTRLIGNAAAVLGGLVAAALIAAYIANRLARPLRELSVSAVAIASGERPTIPIASGDTELADLARAMRAMQSAVARREDELQLLAFAGAQLNASLDYDETMRRAATVSIPGFADWCVVDVLEGTKIARAAVAHVDPAKATIARRLHDSYPPDPMSDRGPVGRVLASGRPELKESLSDRFLTDVAHDEQELSLYRELGPRSFICAPLFLRGQAQGTVMFITAESGRVYDEDRVDLAMQLARRIAMAIDSARLHYELQQSVRTRDDFLTAVAHELKTPLTVVSGAAQLLERRMRTLGVTDPDPNYERIRTAVARMSGFIEELLDMLRRQSEPTMALERQPTDLVAIVRRVVSELVHLARGQRVEIDLESEQVIGEWDPIRLERAIANLLSNAIKYNAPHGRVRIRVGLRDGTAFCAVTDEGIGIPDADRARIFERFARGSNVAGKITGSGVGLTIVRQIVEQHGGTIDLTSKVDRGSTFTIRLPLTPVQAAAAST